MGARRNDPVVGKTEWGGPIYQTAFGHRYWAELPPAKTKRQTIGEILYPDGVRSLEKAPNYSLKTTRETGYDGPGMPTISDAAKAIWGMIGPGMTAPGRALKGEPVTNMDVVNTALDWGLMTAPATAPAGALRAGGIRAYHGSPHDFDRFSMDKIGTGEGKQAEGFGLYFAENPKVAERYRDNLSHRAGVDSGRVYEVNIDASPEEFVDFDSPLTGQPKRVQDWFDGRGVSPMFAGDQSGLELLMLERSAMGDEALAASMRDAGIPGIKYKDAGSRGAEGGTRNYVVFDDKLISILRKYGLLPAAMAGGMYSQSGEASAAQ